MANSQSTTTASSRPSSSRSSPESRTAEPAVGSAPDTLTPRDRELAETHRLRGAFSELIETERARLMAADSVLACVQIALDPEAPTLDKPPFFPDVVKVARELVNKSIRRLDSVNVGTLTAGADRGAP